MTRVQLTDLKKPSRSGSSFSSSCRKNMGGDWDDWTWSDWLWEIRNAEGTSSRGSCGHVGQRGMPLNDTLGFDRNSWYPITAYKISRVWCKVRGTADTGEWGPWLTSPTLTLLPPYSPKVDFSVGVGATQQEVKAKFAFPSETEEREAHDIVLSVTRKANFGTQSQTLHSATCDNSADPNLEWSGNISDIEAGLTQDRWIEVTATARARGFAGDSQVVTESHVFAWPGSPQITKVSYSGTTTSNGMVIVSCKSNQSKYHPTDSVQLQILKPQSVSDSCDTAAQAAIKSGWSNVSGSVDDGDCAGLTMPLSDAYPVDGTKVWFRLVATHDAHTLYSAPAQLPIFNPLPVPGDVNVYAASSGDDGTSVAVDVGWNTDQATSTQISWGTSPDAWASTSGTTDFEFDWEDSSSRSASYDNTARVYVTGLEEGTAYYFKARRVQVLNGETTYGNWSSAVSVTPVSAPAWVDLQAPSVVARGDSLPLTWTFGSDAAQTGWNVIDSEGRVWASGEDANGATTISPDAMDGVSELLLMVAVTTGGDWKASDYKKVVVAERPEVVATVSPSVTSQPVSVSLKAYSAGLDATISVDAVGVSYVRPDGSRVQYAGDIVHAAAYSPSWTHGTEEVHNGEGTVTDRFDVVPGAQVTLPLSSVPSGTISLYMPCSGLTTQAIPEITYDSTNNTASFTVNAASIGYVQLTYDTDDVITTIDKWTATVTLPHMELVNSASYGVSVTAADPTTGLSSDPSECGFAVSWSHTAPAPSCTISADQSELTATISVAEPTGAADGDVCDVYRLTPDGASLIAEGVVFGSEVTDRFAPFSTRGGTSYRVATRTADGDVVWNDFPYTLKGGGLRLDWGENSIELPYNVGAEDQVEKPFEARTHMDGTTEGYWDDGATRTSALSTDLIKLTSRAQETLLREMARFCGAVFVRVANGCAFDANVQLSKVSESYSSGAVSVSLDAHEVALTAEHMCDPSDIVEPEEEEEDES